MRNRIGGSIGLALLLMLGLSGGADAADKIKAVASFSILGDMVKQVGGDRVEVVTLVAPDSDAHVFDPTPADAKMLASADIFFVNGLGFEGWMERLETSSDFKGAVVVASKGVKPLTMREEEGHHHHGEHAKHEEEHEEHAKDEHVKGEDEHEHAEQAKGEDHEEDGEEVTDPHAWQDLANGKIDVAIYP